MAAVAYSCLPPHDAYPFCNISLPEVERLDDLMARLTVAEMVGQLFMDADLAYGNTTYPNSSKGDLKSTGVPRLGIGQFTYMGQGNVYRSPSNGCDINCCTGGRPPCTVDRPFVSVFPQGTGFAATFDVGLAFEAGVAIADESRALQRHVANRTVEYRSGASSVINIARDPRWGRVPETYGECPALTGQVASSFNKGLIGFESSTSRTPPAVMKHLPVIRHFAAYAGPERTRFTFNARVNEMDLELTYLAAWRRMVREGALVGVMSAISAVNGMPGIAHASLLDDVLRGRWGFEGFVLSDCDTFPSLREVWDWAGSDEEAAATAIRAGNDINCGSGFSAAFNATRLGLLTKAEVGAAARRALRMRMRVGDLQPPSMDPWWANAPPLAIVGSAQHAAIVDRVVGGGTVVLHHMPGTLPIVPPPLAVRAGPHHTDATGEIEAQPVTTKHDSNASAYPSSAGARPSAPYTIALIGPSADDPGIQAHTYHGTPKAWITLRAALAQEIKELGRDAAIVYARGCAIDSTDQSGFHTALEAAASADVVIFAGGLYAPLEEEDTDRMDTLGLPGVQPQLLAQLRNVTTTRRSRLIVLLVSGGPLAVPALVPPSPTAPDALLWTSYFGQSALALARILCGTVLPTGRLPFTVPFDASSLPPIDDYDMLAAPGRTYRYLNTSAAPPLFPFGFGLALDASSWRLSALKPSLPRLTIPVLRAAAAEPCTSTTGTGLTVHLTVSRNKSPHGGAPWLQPSAASEAAPSGHAILLFGAVDQRQGPRSPFPRRQLLAFAKPTLRADESTEVTLAICAAELLDEGLGVHRQPLPNLLRLWVGDAQTAVQQVEIPIDLEADEAACE